MRGIRDECVPEGRETPFLSRLVERDDLSPAEVASMG
ncbi:hypothetical protein SAMN04488564_101944 [Lentzea waywayandensis]|uniref:Uncharacterized protein n=1 Tax=Lentzea waywayandensis TaxID=84724 RepID=A0A1I6D2Z9_9PSEU|nr:hypothetical protein SAMN04488564_101944 [Lentzea waywayandensis]